MQNVVDTTQVKFKELERNSKRHCDVKWNKWIQTIQRCDGKSFRRCQLVHATQFRIGANKSHTYVLHSSCIMLSMWHCELRHRMRTTTASAIRTREKQMFESSSSERGGHKSENVFEWMYLNDGIFFLFFFFVYLFRLLLLSSLSRLSETAKKKIENIFSRLVSLSLSVSNLHAWVSFYFYRKQHKNKSKNNIRERVSESRCDTNIEGFVVAIRINNSRFSIEALKIKLNFRHIFTFFLLLLTLLSRCL